ncbi:hypothetical protein INR49_008703 [Caranx melampygus]|nr:hypothetical protein INR49_008703 [Caranx melampygus]
MREPADKEMCLKELCFRAVREHFSALGISAVVDLPVPLIKELLPHLTVCQLDEVQPELNQRGLSTHSGWAAVLRALTGRNNAPNFPTEEEAKHEVMRNLFTLVFYGFRNAFVNRNLKNLKTPSFLWTAAKCMKQILLLPNPCLQSLTAEQWPLLNLLETRISTVTVTQFFELSESKAQLALYVFHRLVDHGVAREIVLHADCPINLAWVLHGRGSQYVHPELKNLMQIPNETCIPHAASATADGPSCSAGLETASSEDEDDQVTPCKQRKLTSGPVEEVSTNGIITVDPQVLCHTFTPGGCPSAGACPWGQIECLKIRQCVPDSLRVLNSALPTFFCLRSLSLHSSVLLRDADVSGLARALRQLSGSCRNSLNNLTIGVLSGTKHVKILLSASPNLTSLHVDIQTVWGPQCFPYHLRTDLRLEKLTIKMADVQTDVDSIRSVLRCSPQLTSLHIAGVALATGCTLCHLLLTLMELRCNDCRLLERSRDKQESLQQLVAAVKSAPSLHTLSLAQNRLAKNVCVLAELFSGSSPSSVKHLNISSNFIQPAELLEFAQKLRTNRPPHRLTLDLRRNPGDRDPDTWDAALNLLHPFCALVAERWKSTDMMADHISNM